TAQAGAPDASGEPFFIDYHDAEGRHVRAAFRGVPEGFPADVLRSALEIATHLGVMVARRAGLERERRLGTFLVELSRWLLAAPERDLLLKYTLQSVVSLGGALIAPLKASSGVAGAGGVVRYEQPGTENVTPPSFGLVDLQYLAAMAAYIAGGLELSEAVTGARAAAERAHAMVDSSPLPLALVDRQGRVLQVNQAGCRLFGIATESQALGLHLEALGLSPSEISLHLILAR